MGVRRPVKVVVVEDHPVTARGIAYVLGEHADIVVAGIARTAADGERLVSQHRPDVLLADLHLPDRTGAELAESVRGIRPGIAVVILSADDTEEAMLEAIEAGAVGYLVKTALDAGIPDAVRRAAAGEMLVPSQLLASLLQRRRRGAAEQAEQERVRASLTKREMDVLRLCAEGLDNARIALRLELRVNSVRGYAQSLLEKLGAHSKLEAVAIAGRLGLLDD